MNENKNEVIELIKKAIIVSVIFSLSFILFLKIHEVITLKQQVAKLKTINARQSATIFDLKKELEQNQLLFIRIVTFKDSMMNLLNDELKFNHGLYKFNWQNICYWVDYYEIKNPSVVKAQILLETNFLTSEVCLYNHNLFGMREPYFKKGRKTIGSYKQHAVYNNYIESIEDYKIWQERMYKFNENYYTFLYRIGYATDKKYIFKLKKIEEGIILKN